MENRQQLVVNGAVLWDQGVGIAELQDLHVAQTSK